QRTDEGSRAHIKNEEHARQDAKSCVTAMKFCLKKILHREQHRTIYVVQEVQRGEQRERELRISLRRGHGRANITRAGNYKAVLSPKPHPELSPQRTLRFTKEKVLTTSFVLLRVLCGYCFFGLGHRATIVVEIPPRGRNSPRTSAQTGFAHFTTSSSTWLTMFS